MKRDVCDRCLTVNVGEDHFATLRITLGVDKDIIDTKMSICPVCQPVVEGIITSRIMLTETPGDVKHGTFFGKPTEPFPAFSITSDTGDEITAADFENRQAKHQGMEEERSRSLNKPGAGDMGG